MNVSSNVSQDIRLNHFGGLVNLAFVDGEFASEEYDFLESLATRLSLTKDERDMILEAPENFTVEIINPISERYTYIYDFFRLIYADNRLDENEYSLVLKYVQKLGFNLLDAKRIVNNSVEVFEKNITMSDFNSFLTSVS